VRAEINVGKKSSKPLTAAQLANQLELAKLDPVLASAALPNKKITDVAVGKTLSPMGLSGGGFSPMTQQIQTGSAFIQQLIASTGVSANQFYGVGNFTTSAWDTTNNLSSYPYIFWNWGLAPRLLAPTNGYMAVTYGYNSGGMPTGEGLLWCPLPDTYLIYSNGSKRIEDGQNYVLRFQYRFMNGTGSYFRCTLNPSLGPVITNLPTTVGTNWNQVTVVMTNIVSYPFLYWVVVHPNTAPTQPVAEIDAVQFFAIPGPSANGLVINCSIVGTNSVVSLQWNTYLYDPSHWHLMYTPVLTGAWATVNVVPVVTDGIAELIFTNPPAQNIMFYRLVHN